ncbi:hypothetical protein EJ04DRAFT_564489 [Polyplosphaeria fusca]|uniref:Uncharacterized protein n=1 Tax=Polyplosphaeria fusca TaxID=682080 RepID=A0A9P4QZT9_9PLEO|nr:hypothetical protein EJ04DRAFT_564489 [Polyplosphaeria fusca]
MSALARQALGKMTTPYPAKSYTLTLRSDHPVPQRLVWLNGDPSPSFRYLAPNPIKDSIIVSGSNLCLFNGITIGILQMYCPGVIDHFKTGVATKNPDEGALEIPANFYVDGLWPHDPKLLDGRPFLTIFEWVSQAFHFPKNEIQVQVPRKLDELMTYFAAIKMLGMADLEAQIEALLIGIFKSRILALDEIKAFWLYYESTIDEHGRIKGFTNIKVMFEFSENMGKLTVKKWRENVKDSHFLAIMTDFARFIKVHKDLDALLFKLGLSTYVNVLERQVGLQANVKRMADWIRDNRKRFADGNKSVDGGPKIFDVYEEDEAYEWKGVEKYNANWGVVLQPGPVSGAAPVWWDI